MVYEVFLKYIYIYWIKMVIKTLRDGRSSLGWKRRTNQF